MPRGRFLCITGIDGAGKTTLAKNLAARLRSQGEPAVYVYCKYVPILTRPLVRLGNKVFLRKENIEKDYQAYSARKRQATQRLPRLAALYRGLFAAEYTLQILLKVRLRLALGRTVVCDRYIHDTLITDLAIDHNFGPEEVQRRLRESYRLCPRPDLLLFLDLPEAVAMARKTDVAALGYLVERRALYRALARSLALPHVDATRSPEAVCDEAEALVRKVLG